MNVGALSPLQESIKSAAVKKIKEKNQERKCMDGALSVAGVKCMSSFVPM